MSYEFTSATIADRAEPNDGLYQSQSENARDRAVHTEHNTYLLSWPGCALGDLRHSVYNYSASFSLWRESVTPRKSNKIDGHPIVVTIRNPMADKIRSAHRIARVGESRGDQTTIEKFCVEIIENFIVDNRKVVGA